MVVKVLAKAGAAVLAQSIIYNVVVQTVFLYEIERWVVKVSMLTVLEGFH